MAFGSSPFYYSTMRKVHLALGALLNGIVVVKQNANGTNLGQVTVDVTQSGKDPWYTRLVADPDLNLGVNLQMPAIAYEMTGIQYDPSRKITSYMKNYVVQHGNTAQSYAAAFPYNMNFEVNIAVRDMDDGFQILEQILPFFTPEYVVAIKYLTSTGTQTPSYVIDEVPFVLENVSFENDYQGTAGTTRAILWTLHITSKVLFFGPTPEIGVIKEVIVNLRNPESGNAFSTITNTVNPFSANIGDSWNVLTTVVETS